MLVDVKGPNDAKNIYKIFNQDSTNIFLSGKKTSSSGSWTWADGSPVDQYDGWTRGQPDSPSSQFCLRMDYDDDGEYRDIECEEDSGVKAVLCQNNVEGMYIFQGCKARTRDKIIGYSIFLVTLYFVFLIQGVCKMTY